jgi:hypothetical protein
MKHQEAMTKVPPLPSSIAAKCSRFMQISCGLVTIIKNPALLCLWSARRKDTRLFSTRACLRAARREACVDRSNSGRAPSAASLLDAAVDKTRPPRRLPLTAWVANSRPIGGTEMTYGRSLERWLKHADLPTDFSEWSKLAQDRLKWRALITAV